MAEAILNDPVRHQSRWSPDRFRVSCPAGPTSQSQSLSRSYGSILPTSLTYIRLDPEAVHLGDLMRSSVRTVTGESYAVRPGFHGPSASRRTPQNPRGSGVFTTRPCPCLRAERFVGTVGRQPEQITLPFERRSASPGLVALRRAIFRTQGTSTVPPTTI